MPTIKVEMQTILRVGEEPNYFVRENFTQNKRPYVSQGYTCIGFKDLPEPIRYKKLLKATIYLYFMENYSDPAQVFYKEVTAKIDPNKEQQKGMGTVQDNRKSITVKKAGWYSFSLFAADVMRGGVALTKKTEKGIAHLKNEPGTVPYCMLEYEDTEEEPMFTEGATFLYPNTGRICFDNTGKFNVWPGPRTLEIEPIKTATFIWREKGKTQETEIECAKSESTPAPYVKSFTFNAPAGTFKTANIEAKEKLVTQSGKIIESPWNDLDELDPAVIDQPTPSSGFVSKVLPNNFAWRLYHEADVLWAENRTPIKQLSGQFKWRTTGEAAENIVEIGTEKSLTIPPNTFTGPSVQWKLDLMAEGNVPLSTEWMTLTTEEPTPETVAKYPDNTVIDNRASNKFSWEYRISSGTYQTRFELQTKTDTTDWVTIRDENTRKTETIFAPNTFKGGNLHWRVRAYNTDGVPSEWSPEVTCIVVAAPERPGLAIVSEDPQFTIRWTQTEQEAYEIRVDGAVVKKEFGGTSNYTYDEYLKDGPHQVSVRIQNKYGLWSEWATASLQIKNRPAEEIRLNVSNDDEPVLTWSSVAKYENYEIYRDGHKIGTTKEKFYRDSLALGYVTYRVRGAVKDSGRYTDSNAAGTDVTVSEMKIADIYKKEWISMGTSETALRQTRTSRSRSITYSHYAGQAMPDASIGDAETITYSISAAWRTENRETIKAFEQLLGKLCCVKMPSGRKIIGVLETMESTENKLITAVTAELTAVQWEGEDA